MVKKLFKHEFMALGRMLVPMYVILLGLSLITRIIVIFENNSVIYNIISVSSIIVLCIGLLVGVIYTTVSCVIRFYRNLFSKEGYLTFTLPVSVEAHLGTKLTCAAVAYIASLGVIFAAFCIATSGELLVEILKAAGFLFGKASEALGADLAFYIIEFIVLSLVSICTSFLLFYACMCIGQLAKRSRVLLALGVYFGYYYLTQIVVTLGMVMMTVLEDTKLFADIINWVELHPNETVHIALIGLIVIEAVLGGVYYLIAHTIMKKKLNLE